MRSLFIMGKKVIFCQLYLVNFRPTMGEKDICQHFLVWKQKSIQTDGSKCEHFYVKFRVIPVLPPKFRPYALLLAFTQVTLIPLSCRLDTCDSITNAIQSY